MQISYMDWPVYTWKNELKTQAERVRAHLAEVLDPHFQGEHSPLNMLERALVLAAFSIRRMIEKRLVTDALAAKKIDVRSLPAKTEDYRHPFYGRSGGDACANYRLDQPETLNLSIKNLADEIIHSSQLMVVGGDDRVPDGLLIASDWNAKRRVLHLSEKEFWVHVQSVLGDTVQIASDLRDTKSGKVTATRS